MSCSVSGCLGLLLAVPLSVLVLITLRHWLWQFVTCSLTGFHVSAWLGDKYGEGWSQRCAQFPTITGNLYSPLACYCSKSCSPGWCLHSSPFSPTPCIDSLAHTMCVFVCVFPCVRPTWGNRSSFGNYPPIVSAYIIPNATHRRIYYPYKLFIYSILVSIPTDPRALFFIPCVIT